MKRVIITVTAVVLALAATAGVLVFINALTSVPSGGSVRESLTYGSDLVDSIDIDINVGYINVYKSTGSLITVDFVESKKELYTAAVNGSALLIRETKSSWIDRLNRTDSDRYGIEIGIPEDKSVKLDIDADSSAVTITGVTLSDNADIAVTTGSISLNGVDTNGCIATDITTGSVKLEYISCSGISADVEEGNIAVRAIDAKKTISLTSDTGKITGVLGGSRNDYRITAYVDTGVCDLESGGEGPVELIATVDVGAIALQFSGDPIR